MKDNAGIICQGKGQEVSRSCSKRNRPVRKAWLTQYLSYIYHNTFNKTGIFISVVHQPKHMAKDEYVQEVTVNKPIWF